MHYPSARDWWERLALWRTRRCGVCGIRWPCDEAVKARLREQCDAVRNDRSGAWTTTPTMAYVQVGRAGNLTPMQAQRTSGDPQ